MPWTYHPRRHYLVLELPRFSGQLRAWVSCSFLVAPLVLATRNRCAKPRPSRNETRAALAAHSPAVKTEPSPARVPRKPSVDDEARRPVEHHRRRSSGPGIGLLLLLAELVLVAMSLWLPLLALFGP